VGIVMRLMIKLLIFAGSVAETTSTKIFI